MSSSKMNRKQADEYQKKELREHIYDIPDTYIGTIEHLTDEYYVLNENNMFDKRQLTICYGLYKIFDELLVNCRDACEHDDTISKIKIDILDNKNIIIENDGTGIPVEMHSEYGIYVPELAFGELLTGTNYNKNDKRTTGGRNGYGAKISNIFSLYFKVEIGDTINNKKLVCEWSDNMTKKKKVKVSEYNKKNGFVKITFVPDYNRFGLSELNKDHIDFIKKRVYDISATTDSKVNVYFNGDKINVKTFDKYIKLYTSDMIVFDKIEKNHLLFEYGITSSNNGFQSISFVNGIYTRNGGTHVDLLVNMIIKMILEKKKKEMKRNVIKDNMFVFVNARLYNPVFDAQTKEKLLSEPKNWGIRFELSDKFINDIIKKTDIYSLAEDLTSVLEQKNAKKTDGKKKSVIRGIPKLEDANFAGTNKSNKCTLILTEGDSAKTFAMSGLSVIGRDYYGVYPLRGKFLNVRKQTNQKVNENKEYIELKQILGLQTNKVYTDISDLRYGRIMILTDADVDGYHIKGLLMNMFDTYWKELLELKFICSMRTPVVKVSRKNEMISFYTLSEYNNWKDNVDNINKYKIKYYKGLGTSSSIEAKEYFSNLNQNMVEYIYTNTTRNSIALAFNDDTNTRKDWLQEYNPNLILDSKDTRITYDEFVNKELIHFSNSDNVRSIPRIEDGFKPSQRKVLYSGLIRNLIQEIKVAQFAGFISEKTSYHHGEQSLMDNIINLAQNYIGSNNINLLYPSGQFGTRLENGKDHASPRYIFTKLSEITNFIFMNEDSPLLHYLNEENVNIEPEVYYPIIPMILVNGTCGIGTGYSTYIPCYNPLEIIDNIQNKLMGHTFSFMIPYYNGFKGSIIQIDNKCLIKGVYSFENKNQIVITEIPFDCSIQKYKEFLEKQLENGLDSYLSYCTENTIHYILTFSKNKYEEYKLNPEKFEKEYNLETKLSLTNMVCYNTNNKIQKYDNVLDILDEYFYVRLNKYYERKDYLLKKIQEKLILLKSKKDFIQYVIDDKIIIFKQKIHYIEEQIQKYNIPKLFGDYKYLTELKWNIFTEENVVDLDMNINKFENELIILEKTSPEELWYNDLENLKNIYKNH
jgi:DNA topoisomerase II